MRTIFALATSVSALAFSAQALASGYPADYCHQVVRVKHEGPALFANVGSGCGSHEVIGYKATGMLASSNPDFVDAVVVASCGADTRTSVVRLGREWNGTGYLSNALSMYDIIPRHCVGGSNQISVAFTAGGMWDSRFGENYRMGGIGMYNENDIVEIRTGQVGNGQVNLAAWEAIVNQMRSSR